MKINAQAFKPEIYQMPLFRYKGEREDVVHADLNLQHHVHVNNR